MLGATNGAGVIERLWAATTAQAQINEDEQAFYEASGPVPRQYETRRAFHRFFFRHPAILSVGKDLWGIYTKDVSREGIGFLSPRQLFPLDEATVLIPGPKKTLVQVRRCRRIAEDCYDIGAGFIPEGASNAFREIASQLELG